MKFSLFKFLLAQFVVNFVSFTFLSLVGRLFTPKIASYYEDYYNSKGVKFVKGTVLSSFEFNSEEKVNLLMLLQTLQFLLVHLALQQICKICLLSCIVLFIKTSTNLFIYRLQQLILEMEPNSLLIWWLWESESVQTQAYLKAN